MDNGCKHVHLMGALNLIFFGSMDGALRAANATAKRSPPPNKMRKKKRLRRWSQASQAQYDRGITKKNFFYCSPDRFGVTFGNLEDHGNGTGVLISTDKQKGVKRP